MAGAAQSNGEDEISGINVTPFVDIALVLLVIFMVTAKYLASLAIPVDLPQAATSQDTSTVETINISLDAHRKLYVDGTPADDAALVQTLRTRLAQEPELRAVISADRHVEHGDFTHLVDLVRHAGLSRFAIQTDPTAETLP